MDLLHSLTIGDLLREHARSYPDRLAVVDGDRRYTWVELDARVDQLADALLASGFGAGDRILWLGQNSFRIIEGLCAAARVGGVFCPANWRSSAAELEFLLTDVEPAVVIWQQAEIGEAVLTARDAVGSAGTWLQHDADDDDPASYEAFLATGERRDPGLDIDPADATLMLYTAAFTGTPNGALLSHTAILVQDLVMGMMQEITNDYVYLNCGPLFHVATFMTTMATFHFGGTNVFTPRVDAEELCRHIDRALQVRS
jgi:long-chain acyl-CoA synthetase